MRALVRAGTVVVLTGFATLVAFQLLNGPAHYVIVSGHSMEPTLQSGDLAFLVRHSSYRRGEIVAYRIRAGEEGAGSVVIHRIIGGSAASGYVTKGDNRKGRDTWRPDPGDVIGSMAFRLSGAGAVPVALATPVGLGAVAGVLAFLLMAGGARSIATRPR